MTRSKKAVLNTSTSILFEVVAAVCSFILTRLILSHFGSAYNGITSSISQFISCIALLKSGIGSVTRAALYKPLAMHDEEQVSRIFVATEKFMRKIAMIFSVALLIFAAIYPFAVRNEFSWGFAFTLVLILGLSTFAQYYFGIAHQMLLEADQRQYIATIINIGGTILNTVVAAVLILLGGSIHIVKLGSAIVFTLQPMALMFYVSHKYHLNRKAEPDNKALSQRWDAFGHQLASFINTNTDIIVLTLATNVFEVSVYTVYCMVAHAVRKAITALTSGMSAAFGNMLAKNENKTLHKYFKLFDFIIFIISAWAFASTAVLIVPFVRVYTRGVTDVSYFRPLFAYLLALEEFIVCIKLPYLTIVQTFGHFKQTRNGAFVEAGINIVASVILVNFIGLEGVMIGTIVSALFRTIDFLLYCQKNMLKYESEYFIKKIIAFFVIVFVCVLLSKFDFGIVVNTYLDWIIMALVKGISLFACTIVLSVILFRSELLGAVQLLISKLKRKKK